MPGGQPTGYNEGIPAKVVDYTKNYEKHGDRVPSIEGLACFLDVSVATLYNWKQDDRKEYLEVLEKLKNKQAQQLINSGLGGIFNSTITKLMLTKHGYCEKSETNLLNNGGSFDGAAQASAVIDAIKSDHGDADG